MKKKAVDSYPEMKKCASILRERSVEDLAPAFYITLDDEDLRKSKKAPHECLTSLLRRLDRLHRKELREEMGDEYCNDAVKDREMVCLVHGGISYWREHSSYDCETFFIFPSGVSRDVIKQAKRRNDEVGDLFPCSNYLSFLSQEVSVPGMKFKIDISERGGIDLAVFHEQCHQAVLPLVAYYRRGKLSTVWDIDLGGRKYKADMEETKAQLAGKA